MTPSEQSDTRELRHAAMWVVLMWDTEQSQHNSMPALRRALGLPGKRPTREEAGARLDAYLQTPCALGAEDCCS